MQSLAPPNSYYFALSYKIDDIIEKQGLSRIEQNNETVTVAYINSIDNYPIVPLFGVVFELIVGLGIEYIPFGIGFLIPLFLILRKRFDDRTMAWTMLLFAVAPFDLIYTTNFYSLTSTITLFLFCVYSAERYMRNPSFREAVMPTIFLFALTFSYYTAAFVSMIVFWIFFIFVFMKNPERRKKFSRNILLPMVPVAIWSVMDFSRMLLKIIGLTPDAEKLIEPGVFSEIPAGTIYCDMSVADFGLGVFLPFISIIAITTGIFLAMYVIKKRSSYIRILAPVFLISIFLLFLGVQFSSGTLNRMCSLRVFDTTFLTSLQLLILCMPAAVLVLEKNAAMIKEKPYLTYWLIGGMVFTIVSVYLGFAARSIIYFIFPLIAIGAEKLKTTTLSALVICSLLLTFSIFVISPIKNAEYLTADEDALLDWLSKNIEGTVFTDMNFGGNLLLRTNNTFPIHSIKRQQDADIIAMFFNSNETLLEVFFENKSVDYVVITNDMKTKGVLPSDIWRQPIDNIAYSRYTNYELIYSENGNDVFKVS